MAVKMAKKMRLLSLILFTLFAGFLLPSGEAVAQKQSAYVGLLLGLSVPDADNTNPYQLYGITGSASLTPSFSFGGYYIVPGKKEGEGGRQFEYSLHGVEAAYHITGNQGDTFIGVRTGLTKIKTQEGGVDLIFSPYHYGFVSGHNYFITKWLAFGFEGTFLRFQSASTQQEGTTYNEDTSNMISFMATAKIRF